MVDKFEKVLASNSGARREGYEKLIIELLKYCLRGPVGWEKYFKENVP